MTPINKFKIESALPWGAQTRDARTFVQSKHPRLRHLKARGLLDLEAISLKSNQPSSKLDLKALSNIGGWEEGIPRTRGPGAAHLEVKFLVKTI